VLIGVIDLLLAVAATITHC